MPVNQKGWTPDQDQYLRDHYQTNPHKVMAYALNRSTASVKHRCRQLNLRRGAKPKSKPSGLPNAKSRQVQIDLQRILDYLTQYGAGSREALCHDLKILSTIIGCRLTLLKQQGLIQTQQQGRGKVWVLGEQQHPTRIYRKDQPLPPDSLFELPLGIRQWFGAVQFSPPAGRHIEERMPDIPLRKASNHIGNGTFGLINALESL